MAKPLYDPSIDRQALNRLLTEFSAILDAFCDHQPLLKGSLQKLARRCGKPRCRCTRGQLHRTTVFVDRRGDHPTLRKVTGPDYRRLRQPTTEYRRLRYKRARLSIILKDVLRTCDRLTRFRIAEGNRIHFSP